ncbi:uncharacterized protein BXZ73DRAFT_41903, partial [Epithele typhae]|uniref:uncharacterized protein n=1 Tax=Epithele typhae TaxID=378194 RepID=UPI00200759CC
HPEKLPSAITRHENEVIRVFGMLESVLSKQEWLLGDKRTIVDILFVVRIMVPVSRGMLLGVEGLDVPTKSPVFYS